MLTSRFSAMARAARHLPDRLLHPWHRWSAMRGLARLPTPGSVLFICHGNICRSPYAAVAARKLLPAAVRIDSAGFIGPDRPSPVAAIAVAAEQGVDLTLHRSQLISPERLRDASVVVVMDHAQRRRLAAEYPTAAHVVLLGDLDPERIATRAVLDPVEKPIEVFRSCYVRIDRCLTVLATLWRSSNGGGRV